MNDVFREEQTFIELPEQPTLRDHFAIAALTGLLTNTPEYRPAHQVQKAYEYADAMLAQREVKG